MHRSVWKTGFLGLPAFIGLVAALAVYFSFLSGGGTSEAATYNPTLGVKLCNALPADFPVNLPSTDADLAGAPACTDNLTQNNAGTNLTTSYVVPGGDSNFGSAVITNAPGTVAAGDGDGGKAGGLKSDVTLGLLGGACVTPLVVEFILFDSVVSGADTTPGIQAEGTSNRWSNIVTDANSDNLAENTSAFVSGNPAFYNTLLTPTGGAYATPRARYTGASKVPAVTGDWQLLSFFQFNAGDLNGFVNANDAPHTFGRISHSPADGILSLSILNDPTAVQASPSPIHDFCSPLAVTTMLLGTEAGTGDARYTSPGGGTQVFSGYSYGQRDEDNDGIENGFDTCPFNANTGDTDSDGIDNSCDPTAGNTGAGDHDSDGFANRQDNCPIDANGGAAQVDSEVATVNMYSSVAPDAGTKSDSIGDACDPNDTTANTEGAVVHAYQNNPKCFGAGAGGGTDADGDKYCAAQDNDDASSAVAGFPLNKGMDLEFRGVTNNQGDSFGGATEVYFGTNPLKRCGFTPGGASGTVAGASENWPADLAESNALNTTDVLVLKPKFGLSVIPAGPIDARFDIAPSKAINTTDVLVLKPLFGASCTAGGEMVP